MKKTVMMLLALILLFSLTVPGLAEETEAPLPDGYAPGREENLYVGLGPTRIEEKGPDGEKYNANYEDGELKTLTIERVDPTGKTLKAVFNPKAKITKASYGDGADQLTYKGGKWTDRAGNPVTGPDLDLMKEYYNYYPKFESWYRNNTMGLIGLYLKELKPELTDKWYMIVPVDLREWGTYRYPCAASNLYYLGAVDVTISTKNVKVDYVLPDGNIGLYVEESYAGASGYSTVFYKFSLDWLTDGNDHYVSVAETPEKEDTLKIYLLLFICNHINYRIPLVHSGQKTAVRYYRGKDNVKTMISQYEKLLKEMQELYPDGAE